MRVQSRHPEKVHQLAALPALYVIDDYHSVSQTFVRREIDMLRARGVQVTCFSLHPTQPWTDKSDLPPVGLLALTRASVAVVFSRRGRTALREVAALVCGGRQRVARQLFALIVAGHIWRVAGDSAYHIHAHFFGRCADIAYYLSGLTRSSYSVTGHAGDVLAPTDIAVLRRNAVSAVGLVGESNLICQSLHALIGSSAKPIITIRSGLPRRMLLEVPAPASLPVRGQPLKIVTVARLVPKKGYGAIVEAAELLGRRGVHFTWTIVGDGPLRDWLTASVQDAPVYVLGPRSTDVTLELARDAHVFVLPCVTLSSGESDGLPAALIEALALGTPVITTAVGAIPELVRDGVTGLVVPQRDAQAVADAIMRLCTDQDLYYHLVTAGSEEVRRSYILEDEIDRLKGFFRVFGVTSSEGVH